MSKNKEFKILVGNLLFTYREYCLNRVAHQKIDTELYQKFLPTWNTILLGLEEAYLLGLAKFFDKNQKYKPASIYYFLSDQYKFVGHQRIINKIKKLRDRLLAHYDAKTMRKIGSFLKKVHIQPDKINLLFNKAIETVDSYRLGFELDNNLKERFAQEKQRIENEFVKLLEVFRK